jgi:hypothetical protein
MVGYFVYAESALLHRKGRVDFLNEIVSMSNIAPSPLFFPRERKHCRHDIGHQRLYRRSDTKRW